MRFAAELADKAEKGQGIMLIELKDVTKLYGEGPTAVMALAGASEQCRPFGIATSRRFRGVTQPWMLDVQGDYLVSIRCGLREAVDGRVDTLQGHMREEGETLQRPLEVSP